MQKKIDKGYSFLAMGLLLMLCIANLCTPRIKFSENENRYLTQFPELTVENILNGRFTEKFEEYATDQFIGRGFWVSGKAHLERVMGKKENNGVYFANDGYFIEKQSVNEDRLEKNIEAILKLQNLSAYRTGFLLIPTASEILKDRLPPFAYQDIQKDMMDKTRKKLQGSGILYINPAKALQERKDEYLYYHTDHHQTTLGAYLDYTEVAKSFGFTPYLQTDFNQETLSDTFLGTTWSKTMLQNTPRDTITAFYPKFSVSYKMYFPVEKKEMEGLYAPSHLKTKDQYSVFLDGNHSIVEIKSTVKNGRRLAIFKDSYAHSIVPFLANHYEEIDVIDLRYYNLDPFLYLQEHKIDDILLIYNAQNFATDVNIAKLGIYIEDKKEEKS